jgi:hypothetical protein
LANLALDLSQLCFDLAGIVDPTPVSDTASLLISLGRGRWFDALVSGVSLVPYVGDLAKLGKLQRYLDTVKQAIALARESVEAQRLLAPILVRIGRVVDAMPNQLPAPLMELRRELRAFANAAPGVTGVARLLPDIRNQFRFRRYRQGGFEYQEASGRLGIPGKVMTHDSPTARRAVSSGSGDHAGHLIGERFGAPTDGRNLSLQNANINTYAPRELQPVFQGPGGSYLRLEDQWEEKLKRGIGIEVTIRDKFRPGDARPFGRLVEWFEIAPNGTRTRHSLDFLNSSSPQSRAATR